jgi:FkbM family methyltransferase
MNNSDRQQLIATVSANEALRPLSRLTRLMRDPIGAFPYYILAALSRIKPYRISFRTLWGTTMTCYLPEGNTFYYYGYCEANLTNFYLRAVTEGMTVIDVGAHVGIYSMLSSELVGPTGHVYSFEPTPWTFRILTENTKKLSNVTILNQAISETEQQLTFADYGPGYGAYNSANKSGAPDTTRTPEKITVTSRSLDSFCSEKNIHPDIIKIDSEGYEREVLLGSKGILTNTSAKRPLVSIEVAGGATWAENSHQAFDLLTSYGYIPYEIHPDGTIAPHTFKETYTYDNLLFIPTERQNEYQSLKK